jgi:hypothetical protein
MMTSDTPDPRGHWHPAPQYAVVWLVRVPAQRGAQPHRHEPRRCDANRFRTRATRLVQNQGCLARLKQLSHAREIAEPQGRYRPGAIPVPADVLTRDNPHLSRPKKHPSRRTRQPAGRSPPGPPLQSIKRPASRDFVQLCARLVVAQHRREHASGEAVRSRPFRRRSGSPYER